MSENIKIIYSQTRNKNELDNTLSEFVGIEYSYNEDKGGKIVIYYPKTLGVLPSNNLKDDKKTLLNLIKSLKLVKNIDDSDRYYDNRIESINLDRFPLYSYLWIWDDFKIHGRLIFNETKDERLGTGKINWKKTLQGSPLIYQDNIYFNDFVFKNKKRTENLLTEIYDYCVYKSIEMLFFITNLSQNIVHPIYKDIKGKRIEYITCLNDVIESVFNDEKKLRYQHMLNIVESKEFDSINDKKMLGVSSYASVFEREIDYLFGNVSDISKYYPEAYISVEGENPKLLGRLRQDTINKQEKECYIIDSKFYEFGNMPAAESVEKQIVYGEYAEVKRFSTLDNIYNIFLIPRCFEEEHWDVNDVIKYHGYSYSKWKKNNKNYEYVLIYFIDLKYVINNYRNGYNKKLFATLKEDVKKRIRLIPRF